MDFYEDRNTRASERKSESIMEEGNLLRKNVDIKVNIYFLH